MSKPARFDEVLAAALSLFAERGYAGASLRELARRLGMSQPSLYHYFDSKEHLVELIIEHLGRQVYMRIPDPPYPSRLEDLPPFVADAVLKLYENPMYPIFVRFMFAVGLEHPRFGEKIRALFGEVFAIARLGLMTPFIERGELTDRDAKFILQLIVQAVGLSLLEERVIYGHNEPTPEVREFAAFVAEMTVKALSAR